MKKILLFTAIAFYGSANAQVINVGFETPVLAADTAWFGQDQVIDGDTLHTETPLTFELNYNASWQSYSGWAISNETDIVTPGYGNQFSAITGTGAGTSDQYAVCYASQWSNNRVFSDGNGWLFAEMKVTNTTYAYDAMLNGDGFSKIFGTDTSAAGVNDGTNGEDWFLLTIYSLDSDSLRTGDSINYYLADYRFANPADDYIVNTWETVDLSPFWTVSDLFGLDFVLSSSDTSGGFGMNTPAYFAVDDLSVVILGLEENETDQLAVYPNPTNSDLTVATEPNSILQLFDLNGRLIIEELAISTQLTWDLSFLDAGMYTLISTNGMKQSQTKVIKQ